jgi:anti-anti-sigma factor
MKYYLTDLGNFKMIHISGNIDTEEDMKKLDEEIFNCMKNGFHNFVFDLENTTYLDSAGISIFIHCLCDVQENKGSVFIIAKENQARRVLDMVGISRLIKTYNTETDFIKEQINENKTK